MPRSRDPKTKEELLDRMLSFDFNGDIRHLGKAPASIVRSSPNRLLLRFPDSGRTFELVARIPRESTIEGESRSFAHAADTHPFPEAEAEATHRENERGQAADWTA